jgi:hypothetical protein
MYEEFFAKQKSASNVLLRDYTFKGNTDNQQIVTTDFGVKGDVYIYGELKIVSNVSIDGTLNAGDYFFLLFLLTLYHWWDNLE